MFCREQVAQLRDVVSEIRDKGAELVVVGSGKPAQAKTFAEERDLDFPLLTDPGRQSYGAAGLKRSVQGALSLKAAAAAARAIKGGHRQGPMQGDPWQLGGAFVIGPDDRLHFRYVSSRSGDHPDPRDLVAAVPAV